MGHSKTTAVSRVPVAVSLSMARLREIFAALNGFWQTTELSYGHLLYEPEKSFPDLTRSTIDVLGHIESQVWYPNNQGRIKREVSIGETLKQVRENTVHVYRATLLSFYSVFEAYLDAEVTELKHGNDRWGPFFCSLSGSELRGGIEPLPLSFVLRADLCRKIRNRMVHEAFNVPTSPDDPEITRWRQGFDKSTQLYGWPEGEITDAVDDAVDTVIGKAERGVRKAKKKGKELPIEMFYMLFTFTNFANLAFAIEEALRPLHSNPGGRIYHPNNAVRRRDLIIQ